MLALIAAASAALSVHAAKPAEACRPALPPGSFRVADLTLLGAGANVSGAGGGGPSTDGQLDFSIAQQSGLLSLF